MSAQRNRRLGVSLRGQAVLAAAVMACGAGAYGQTVVTWDGTTGPYTTATNWNPDTVPSNAANQFLSINNAGTATVTTGDAAEGAFLHLGLQPGDTGSLSINGGTLTLGEFRVGGRETIPDLLNPPNVTPNGGGTGTVTQTGGNVFVTYNNAGAEPPIQSLYLGDAGLSSGNTANGTYNISGGTLTSGIRDNDAIVVGTGIGSSGTFIQSGGTVASTGFVTVGRRGATSTYTMTGGTLNVGIGATTTVTGPTRNLWIGDGDTGGVQAGSGTFTQSNGAIVNVGDANFNATQLVEIGRRSGTGTYNLSSGQLNVPNGGIVVGGGGQDPDGGGPLLDDPNLMKGQGFFNLSGTGAVTIGDSQTDGATGNNSNRGNMSIGFTSPDVSGGTTTGYFDMDGGTFTDTDVNGIVAVGNGIGSMGTLDISAGTFSVDGIPSTGNRPVIDVGRNSGNGLLKLSGTGTVNVNQFTINSSTVTANRELRIEGGTMNVQFWEMGSVNTPATRTINMSGGALNVTDAAAAHRAGRLVTYNFTGGTANFAGVFPLDTSTMNVGGVNNPSVTFSTYRNGSGTTNVTNGGTLNITTVNNSGNQGGTWNVSGGTFNVSGSMNITNAGPATPGKLNLTGGGGTINSLTTGGTGTGAGSLLYISGGTHTITNLSLTDASILRSDNTITKNSAVTLAGTVTADVNSGSLELTGNVSGGLTNLVKTGPGTLTLSGTSTYVGGTTVNAGTMKTRRLQEFANVNVNAGLLQVMESSPGLSSGHPAGNNAFVSRPLSLSVAPGATLDITNNDVILDYTGASPVATYEALVASGYNVVGDWNGDGITSSVAALDGNYVVGIADNAALAAPFGTAQGGPLFAGQDVDLDTVLIKFTHRADINLDGVVTPDDSAIFGGNYDENQPAVWATGDMNYDGIFTPDDAAIFGGAYDESLASLPEPGSLAAVALLGLGFARRRRRAV